MEDKAAKQILQSCISSSSKLSLLASNLEKLEHHLKHSSKKQDERRCIAASLLNLDFVMFTHSSTNACRLLDSCLDECGFKTSLLASVDRLREAESGKCPTSSVITALWTCKRRYLPEDPRSFSRLASDFDRVEDLVNGIVLFPVRAGAACHAAKVELPNWVRRSDYFARLVECAICAALADEELLPFLQQFWGKVIVHGEADSVSQAIYRVWDRNKGCDEDLQTLIRDVMTELSPKEAAKLMQSFFQYSSSLPHSKETVENSIHDTCDIMMPFLTVCCLPTLQFAPEIRDAVVNTVILSPSPSSSSPEIPFCMAMLLAACDSKDTSRNVLSNQFHEVVEVWCQPLFIRHTDQNQQYLITNFILKCLEFLSQEDIQTSSTNLVQGVSARLESSLIPIRKDGMRVAERFATLVGQDLRFDELDEERELGNVVHGSSSKAKEVEPTATREITGSSSKHSNILPAEFDPTEEYFSDDDSSTSSIHDNEPNTKQQQNLAHSSYYKDFITSSSPLEIQNNPPQHAQIYYLRDCLSLLRTSENDNDAYTNHETALQQLPSLAKTKPPDLPDLAAPLVKEVLHMQNKFNMTDFDVLRENAIMALSTQEPVLVSEVLIEDLFDGGVSLGTRIEILEVLANTARVLCGDDVFEQHRSDRKRNKKDLLPEYDESSRTRRWGKIRRKKPLSITNRFGPMAPSFFYPLLQKFMQSRDSQKIWNSSRFMGAFLTTLSTIIECSGNYPGTSFLASDLFTLVFSLRDAEQAEVRQAVLICIGSCVGFLPDVFFLEEARNLVWFLEQTAREDADKGCRDLAKVVAGNVAHVLSLRSG